MTKAPDCYQCKWRGDVIGSAHSICHHPKVEAMLRTHLVAIAVNLKQTGHIPPLRIQAELNVVGDRTGVRKGWFRWPLDFDHVWLESCNGFEQIEQT